MTTEEFDNLLIDMFTNETVKVNVEKLELVYELLEKQDLADLILRYDTNTIEEVINDIIYGYETTNWPIVHGPTIINNYRTICKKTQSLPHTGGDILI